MAIALVANVKKQGDSTGSGNSAAIDTSGSSLLVMVVSDYDVSTASVPTDSKSNTWTSLTAQVAGGGGAGRITIFYVTNPTVGTGHTFASNGTNTFASIAVQAFSGASTSSPFDQQNGNVTTTGFSPLTTGSITPSADNEVVCYGQGCVSIQTRSVSVGSITDQANLVGGSSFSIAAAYIVQTTAGAVNPSWSSADASQAAAAVIASFKVAGAGGATRPVKMAGAWGGYAGESGGFAG